VDSNLLHLFLGALQQLVSLAASFSRQQRIAAGDQPPAWMKGLLDLCLVLPSEQLQTRRAVFDPESGSSGPRRAGSALVSNQFQLLRRSPSGWQPLFPQSVAGTWQ